MGAGDCWFKSSRLDECGRGRWVRHFVANEDQAGSNPAVRSTTALAARRSCGGFVSRWRRFDSDRGLDGLSDAGVADRKAAALYAERCGFESRRRLDDHSSVAKRYCARLLTEMVQVRVLPLELELYDAGEADWRGGSLPSCSRRVRFSSPARMRAQLSG